jgi:hypothetical protein
MVPWSHGSLYRHEGVSFYGLYESVLSVNVSLVDVAIVANVVYKMGLCDLIKLYVSTLEQKW